jgi:hypothetical protein
MVALGTALLVSAPIVRNALPVGNSDVTARVLLDRVERSAAVDYSGFAHVQGNIQLPVTDRFSGLAKLLGESSDLRVWWRGKDDWRVDSITTRGESDLIKSGRELTSWGYESNRVIRSSEPDFRLPQISDFVPAVLGRTLLDDADTSEVVRIKARRVAAKIAPGLRVRPHDARSTVDHVDVWADERTGLVLDVRAYAKGDPTPALAAHFVSIHIGTPTTWTTTFVPPPNALASFDRAIDIGPAVDQFAPVAPPSRLIGLRRDPSHTGAVGKYGRGQTVVVAIPLWHSAADELRQQLERAPGSELTGSGVFVGMAPVNILLTDDRPGRSTWLLIGTIRRASLVDAGVELTVFDR